MEEKKHRSLDELKKTFVFVNSKTDDEEVIRAFTEKEAREQLAGKLPDKGTIDNWELSGAQG